MSTNLFKDVIKEERTARIRPLSLYRQDSLSPSPQMLQSTMTGPSHCITPPSSAQRYFLTMLRYMAKAPTGTSAANFDGSGQVWFKILDLGPTFNSDGSVSWPLYRKLTILNFLSPLRNTNNMTSRDLQLYDTPESSQWRLSPPAPTIRNPQSLSRWNTSILHRVRATHSHRWRNRNSGPSGVYSRLHHRNRTRICSGHLHGLHQLHYPRPCSLVRTRKYWHSG
jgi:hypothetical protein